MHYRVQQITVLGGNGGVRRIPGRVAMHVVALVSVKLGSRRVHAEVQWVLATIPIHIKTTIAVLLCVHQMRSVLGVLVYQLATLLQNLRHVVALNAELFLMDVMGRTAAVPALLSAIQGVTQTNIVVVVMFG